MAFRRFCSDMIWFRRFWGVDRSGALGPVLALALPLLVPVRPFVFGVEGSTGDVGEERVRDDDGREASPFMCRCDIEPSVANKDDGCGGSCPFGSEFV